MNQGLVISKIEKMIYIIRGHRVMIDSDLAELYGVETKRLNEQVRRNLKRFPEDFMFQLTNSEFEELKTTSGILSYGSGGKHKLPLVFTENGVAMLSGILNSERAIEVNISIMRIFTKLRSFLLMDNKFDEKFSKLESNTNYLFKIVFERLDSIEDANPTLKPNRRKISITKDAKESG